ncbi:MAG: TIGR03619 family F420-dependent LLM class oxidoreductase [Acidimicrobiales bacterium]
MKFGFVLPNNWGLDDPAGIVDLAVEAEQAGLDSVWVNHHVINVGYIADRLGDKPYYDALTILGWVGAKTERVQLGTSVLVMPYLHPMVVAKSLATLDQLSNGRIIAGLGVGSLPEENAILDVDYDDRGARSDEFIEVMRALWADGPASFNGDHYQLDQVVASPNPAQKTLEMWIGGTGAPARARAARYGQGWHPMCSANGLAKRLPKMADALAEHGRSLDDLVVAPRIGIQQVADEAAIEAWAAAGANQLIVGTASSELGEIRSSLADLAAVARRWRGES